MLKFKIQPRFSKVPSELRRPHFLARVHVVSYCAKFEGLGFRGFEGLGFRGFEGLGFRGFEGLGVLGFRV